VAWRDTQAFIVSGAATPALRASPFGDTLRPSLAGPKGYRGRGAIMARQPKADFAVLSNVIEDATLHWFVETGVILHPEEFKPAKRFSDYNINMPAFIELYDVVVDKVRLNTGKTVSLSPAKRNQIYSGTVSNFIGALPGEPTTGSSGPIKPRK
jgi:hypothetical protein